MKVRCPQLYADLTNENVYKDGFYRIMTVKNQDGSYRPLDERTVAHLEYGDLQRDGAHTFGELMDRYNDSVKQAMTSDLNSKLQWLATDELQPRLRKETSEYNLYQPAPDRAGRRLYSFLP